MTPPNTKKDSPIEAAAVGGIKLTKLETIAVMGDPECLRPSILSLLTGLSCFEYAEEGALKLPRGERQERGLALLSEIAAFYTAFANRYPAIERGENASVPQDQHEQAANEFEQGLEAIIARRGGHVECFIDASSVIELAEGILGPLASRFVCSSHVKVTQLAAAIHAERKDDNTITMDDGVSTTDEPEVPRGPMPAMPSIKS